MDLKRSAVDSVSAALPKRKKLDEVTLQRKILRLMALYKELGAEIRKIDEREISFSDNYNEEEEMRIMKRHQILSKKRLAIYKYLARKGALVNEEEHQLTENLGENNRIIINNTGIERLNDLLTDFVNNPAENEAFFGVLGSHRHLSYEDVKNIVGQLCTEKEGKLIPDDPVEYEKFITNVALAANRKVKEFVKKRHEEGMDELLLSRGVTPSELQKQIPEHAPDLASTSTSWENANMELSKALENEDDELTGENPATDVFETDMPCTEEELDEEEEFEETSSSVDLDLDEAGDDSHSEQGSRVLYFESGEEDDVGSEEQPNKNLELAQEHLEKRSQSESSHECLKEKCSAEIKHSSDSPAELKIDQQERKNDGKLESNEVSSTSGDCEAPEVLRNCSEEKLSTTVPDHIDAEISSSNGKVVNVHADASRPTEGSPSIISVSSDDSNSSSIIVLD